MGKLGWIAAFVYVAGAALRLARFNTMLDVADKRWFTGMPSPAAAALVAGFVWIVDDYALDPASVSGGPGRSPLFAGLTMVSNVKYYSFKTINLKKSVPFLVDLPDRDLPRAAVLPAGDRAVRRLRRLRGVGVRGHRMDDAAASPRAAADPARDLRGGVFRSCPHITP